MAKPILFSLTFPSYHPRAGQPTFFVEKIWLLLAQKGDAKAETELASFRESEMATQAELFPKSHTIRKGHRWKPFEKFSPRIWSGPAYRSKQIAFANELTVQSVWDILILPSYEVFINGQLYGFYGSPEVDQLALHDGLSPQDFRAWFSKLPFDGQIICWDTEINYEQG